MGAYIGVTVVLSSWDGGSYKLCVILPQLTKVTSLVW
jgi:hypothetical protein